MTSGSDIANTAAVTLHARMRRLALALVIVAQIAFFVFFVPKPPVVEQDNVRYETAGWLLAAGHGFSLPYEMYSDPDTRAWACERHPSACTGDLAPTAIYAPGYSLYIASVYAVTGRSLWALVATQLALLVAMFVVFERAAARRLGRVGYVFTMAICVTYPFLARQAGLVMSDHLHTVLLVCALCAFDLLDPGVRRGLLVGLLFSLATLTRPYSVVGIPLLLGAVALQRTPRTSRAELLALGGSLGLPIALWALRNEITFGRFIPFSTAGIGVSLYLNKVEATLGSSLDPNNVGPIFAELHQVGGDDFTYWRASPPLSHAAFAWMKDHPDKMLVMLAGRIPRVWVSLGMQGQGLSRAWPGLVAYLGGLLVLGCAGMWLRRKDRSTWIAAVVVLSYWAFLLHTPAEARRTLPLRLPMLLFAGYAVDRMFAGRLSSLVPDWLRPQSPVNAAVEDEK